MSRLYNAVFTGARDITVTGDYLAAHSVVANWTCDWYDGASWNAAALTDVRNDAKRSDGTKSVIRLTLADGCKIGRVYRVISPLGTVYAYSTPSWGRFWYLDIEGLPELSDTYLASPTGRVVIDSRYFSGVGAIKTVSSKLNPLTGDLSRELAIIKLLDIDGRLNNTLFNTSESEENFYEFALAYPITAADTGMILSGVQAADVLADGDYLFLEREVVRITSTPSNALGNVTSFDIDRAQYGTTATQHALQLPVYQHNHILEERLVTLYVCEKPDYTPTVVYKGKVDSVLPSQNGLGYDFKIKDILAEYDKPLTQLFATARHGIYSGGKSYFPNAKLFSKNGRNDLFDVIAVNLYDEDDYTSPYGSFGCDFWRDYADLYHGCAGGYYAGWPWQTLGGLTMFDSDFDIYEGFIPLVRGVAPQTTGSLSQSDLPYSEQDRGWDELLNHDASESRGYDATWTGDTYLLCKPRPQIFQAKEFVRKTVEAHQIDSTGYSDMDDFARNYFDYVYRLYFGAHDILRGYWLAHETSPNIPEFFDDTSVNEYGLIVNTPSDELENTRLYDIGTAKIETVEECLPFHIYPGLNALQAALMLLTGYAFDVKVLPGKYISGVDPNDVITAGDMDRIETGLPVDGVLCRDTGESLVKVIQKELLTPCGWLLGARRNGTLTLNSLSPDNIDRETQTEITEADLLSIVAGVERIDASVNEVSFSFGYSVYTGKYSNKTTVRAPANGGKAVKFELKLLQTKAAGDAGLLKAILTAYAANLVALFGRPQYVYELKIRDTAEFRNIGVGEWLKISELPLGTNRFGQTEINGDGLVTDCSYHIDEGYLAIKVMVVPRAVGASDREQARQAFCEPIDYYENDGNYHYLYFRKGEDKDGRVGKTIYVEPGWPYGMVDGATLIPRDICLGDDGTEFQPVDWQALSIGDVDYCVATVPVASDVRVYPIEAVFEFDKKINIQGFGDLTSRFRAGTPVKTTANTAPQIVTSSSYSAGMDLNTIVFDFWAGDFPTDADYIFSLNQAYSIANFDDLPEESMKDYHVFMDSSTPNNPGWRSLEAAFDDNEATIQGNEMLELGGCLNLTAWGSDDYAYNSIYHLTATGVTYDEINDVTVVTVSPVLIAAENIKLVRDERGRSYNGTYFGEVSEGEGFYKFK